MRLVLPVDKIAGHVATMIGSTRIVIPYGSLCGRPTRFFAPGAVRGAK
jgi:hypothetical protein